MELADLPVRRPPPPSSGLLMSADSQSGSTMQLSALIAESLKKANAQRHASRTAPDSTSSTSSTVASTMATADSVMKLNSKVRYTLATEYAAANAKSKPVSWKTVQLAKSERQLQELANMSVMDAGELKRMQYFYWNQIEAKMEKALGMYGGNDGRGKTGDQEDDGEDTSYGYTKRKAHGPGKLIAFRERDIKNFTDVKYDMTKMLRPYERVMFEEETLVLRRVTHEEWLKIIKANRANDLRTREEVLDEQFERQWAASEALTLASMRTGGKPESKITTIQELGNFVDKIRKTRGDKRKADQVTTTDVKTIESSSSTSSTSPADEELEERKRIEELLREANGSGVGAGDKPVGGYGGSGFGVFGAKDKKFKYDMSRPPPPGYLCVRCNVPGHWVKKCPQLRLKGGAPDSYDSEEDDGVHHIVIKYADGKTKSEFREATPEELKTLSLFYKLRESSDGVHRPGTDKLYVATGKTVITEKQTVQDMIKLDGGKEWYKHLEKSDRIYRSLTEDEDEDEQGDELED